MPDIDYTNASNLTQENELINKEQLWQKANSLRGCLFEQRQIGGRRRLISDEDRLTVLNPYVSDEAKLFKSKAFRTLGDKTQVFTMPKNALIRTRLSHVLEVVAVSVIASELLGLNTDLVRAAAIGHDIGHGPLGHQGEAWRAKRMGKPDFCHEIMGPIIAQRIERQGNGLNLCHETLEAMMCHSGKMARRGMSQEAWVLRYTDKFTYIFHDVNDIIDRMRYPASQELRNLINDFGNTQRERTTTAIAGLVVESSEFGSVSFERSELGIKFSRLRTLMYELYPRVTQQNVESILEPVLEFIALLGIGDPFLILSLMTDKDTLMIASRRMKDMDLFNQTAVSEITPHLDKIGPVDLCDPGLNW